MPLFRRHAVERRIACDACVCDDNFYGAKVSFDLSDACGAFLVACYVPFVGFYTGFGGEFCSGFVIACICCGNGIASVFQRG
jgi:hypothetical protein